MVRQTSLEAFESIKESIGKNHKTILDLVGGSDWSNSELARELGWGINRVTPRVFELRKKGLLKELETQEEF